MNLLGSFPIMVAMTELSPTTCTQSGTSVALVPPPKAFSAVSLALQGLTRTKTCIRSFRRPAA